MRSQLFDSGQRIQHLVHQPFQLLLIGCDGVNVQATFPRHPVNLRDGGAFFQPMQDLRQRAMLRLQFVIAGYGASQLLRIDDDCITFDNSPFFQCIHAIFDGYSGKPQTFPQLRVGVARVLRQ